MDRASQLCELKIFLQPLDDKIALIGELRVGCAEFDDTEPPFSVHLRQLILDFDISGLDILPGTRLGEPVLPNAISLKTSEKQEILSTVTGKAAATLSFNPAGLKGELSGGADRGITNTVTKSRELSEDTQFLRVRALGGDKWRVAEPEGARLDGTYLDGIEHLCVLKQRVKI